MSFAINNECGKCKHKYPIQDEKCPQCGFLNKDDTPYFRMYFHIDKHGVRWLQSMFLSDIKGKAIKAWHFHEGGVPEKEIDFLPALSDLFYIENLVKDERKKENRTLKLVKEGK